MKRKLEPIEKECTSSHTESVVYILKHIHMDTLAHVCTHPQSVVNILKHIHTDTHAHSSTHTESVVYIFMQYKHINMT